MSDLSAARRVLADRPDLVARLLFLAAEPAVSVVRAPSDVLPILRSHLTGHETERLVCVAMDSRYRVIEHDVITTGNSGLCVVCPKQIFRWALTRKRPAAAIILAHNHPSGDPTPSSQDRDVTERVARTGRLLGISLLDHIVIGSGDTWASMSSVCAVGGSNLDYIAERG